MRDSYLEPSKEQAIVFCENQAIMQNTSPKVPKLNFNGLLQSSKDQMTTIDFE